jgi:hypothetical protein
MALAPAVTRGGRNGRFCLDRVRPPAVLPPRGPFR